MQSIGGLLFFLGVGSIALHFLDMEFRLLSWVDNWGIEAGWGIRAAMIVVGAVLWLMSQSGDDEDESEA